ncbi:hypothetical protein ID866_12054 [Astraeus odoratus]|nr:hypothetical protein ID866_12054 [Astraeus odoratus]
MRVWNADSGVQIGSPLQGHTEGMHIESNLEGVAVISHALLHSLAYPITFSSSRSHALHDGQILLCGCPSMNRNVWQPVHLYDDGWIRGPHNQLLLWVPHALQKPFYSMHTTLVLPKGCAELDLSSMVAHGYNWERCFQHVKA